MSIIDTSLISYGETQCREFVLHTAQLVVIDERDIILAQGCFF